MRSKSSIGLRIILLVVLVSYLILSGCVILPRRAFPKTSGSPQIEGLNDSVEIIRDRYGVPHIYGTNPEDLYFAHGYVHAQDRFWQMEFSRRVGSGRLSELFGKTTLETDIFLRTLGFRYVADEEYRTMEPNAKKLLNAYVAGVNAYIKDKKPGNLGLEYTFLKLQGTDFEIEEWEPQDSLTWAKMMAWDLANNMSFERTVLSILRTAGYEGTLDYYAPYRSDMPVIVDDDEMWVEGSAELEPVDLTDQAALAGLFLGRDTGEGSNSWVVSGSRTESGKPILANDTHLTYGMPSIFYKFSMHQVNEDGTPDETDGTYHVRGFSFPGYPGLIIGHTNKIAWGITDFGDDVQDLFLERFNPANPNQYEVDGEWRDMEIRHERFDIQGQREPFIHIVRSTHHGPVISDRGGYKVLEGLGYSMDEQFPGNLELNGVSLAWTALKPGKLLEAQVGMCLAETFPEFREALSKWNGPVQNITYADVHGNIGYQTAGWVPIRGRGDGRIPAPGWLSEFDWTGYVPFEEMPVSFNPEKGFIVTANNKATTDNYPYNLGTNFAYGYRAKRITELIEADTDGITVDDMKVMQADTFDIAGKEILAYLEDLDLSYDESSEILEELVPSKDKEKKKREEFDAKVQERMEPAREMLVEWDGYFDRDSSAAALYGFFLVALAEEVYKDQYPHERWSTISGRQIQNSLYYLLDEPDNPLWDNIKTPDIVETRDGMLVRSLRRALRYGIEELGDDLEKWEWGSLHKTEFVNASLGKSGIGVIEKVFNRGPISSPGSMTTINVGSWYFAEPFDTYHGVACREIIDMADLSNSFMIHPTGQSGHPRHKHYDDYMETWRDVEYHPTLWEREDVIANKKARMVLQPAE